MIQISKARSNKTRSGKASSNKARWLLRELYSIKKTVSNDLEFQLLDYLLNIAIEYLIEKVNAQQQKSIS